MLNEVKSRSAGRKIIATEFYTLDGLMSDPKDEMEWVLSTFSEDLGKYEDDLYERADTLILGRVTYKIFESYCRLLRMILQHQKIILKWLVK